MGDGVYLEYDMPVLFSTYENALTYANKIKNNPNLLIEHYIIEDEKYEKSLKRRGLRTNHLKKSIII